MAATSMEEAATAPGLTHRERYFTRLFPKIEEILTSVSRVGLSRRLLGRLRPRSADAERVAYYVEKHLEDIYIVRERVYAYLIRLERDLKKKGLIDDAANVARTRTHFLMKVDAVVGVRGAHVHQRRFYDADIEMLASLDLVAKHGAPKELGSMRDSQVRVVLGKWRGVLTARHREVEGEVARVLSAIEAIVFEKMPPPPPRTP